VAPNGAPLRWTPGRTQSCDSALRANRSERFWGDLEVAQYSKLGKTVACLFLDHRKLGSCVYSPALAHR
jgi:hypothetical protein